jgi:hypothetical protein
MAMLEGRGVQPKIMSLRRCHLLLFLFKAHTKVATMLHTLLITANPHKKSLIYPILVMISWYQLPMSLVMDTHRLRQTPQLMTSHTIDSHINHL